MVKTSGDNSRCDRSRAAPASQRKNSGGLFMEGTITPRLSIVFHGSSRRRACRFPSSRSRPSFAGHLHDDSASGAERVETRGEQARDGRESTERWRSRRSVCMCDRRETQERLSNSNETRRFQLSGLGVEQFCRAASIIAGEPSTPSAVPTRAAHREFRAYSRRKPHPRSMIFSSSSESCSRDRICATGSARYLRKRL